MSWPGWAEGDLGAAHWPEGAGEHAFSHPFTSVFPVAGAALAGACPQAWRSKQFTAALVIRAPLPPCPPPSPPARRSTLLGGCLRCQWLPSQEEEAPGTWAGHWGQPQRLPPGPPVPADGGWRSCLPVAWQVQATHSRLGESCVPET